MKDLFRGKRIDNCEWVEGYLILKGNQTFISSFPYFVGKVHETSWLEFCFGGFIEVIPETVGQYTGLTDKNGKKIFEGDILEGIRYGNEERAEVLWIDKAASWGIRYSFREKNESGYTSWLNSAWFRTINDARGPVVIGNIHDNPELLEVEQ